MSWDRPTDWHVSYFTGGDWRICSPAGTCLRNGDNRPRSFGSENEAGTWLDSHREKLPDAETYKIFVQTPVHDPTERTVTFSARPWDYFELEEEFGESLRRIERLQRGKGSSVSLTGSAKVLAEIASILRVIFEGRKGVDATLYENYYQAGQMSKAIAAALEE
jgi:hypothetical protein